MIFSLYEILEHFQGDSDIWSAIKGWVDIDGDEDFDVDEDDIDTDEWD